MRTYRPSALILPVLLAFGPFTMSAAEPVDNRLPTAHAGHAHSVAIGEMVRLDASGSSDLDGDSIEFLWKLKTPPGSAARLGNARAARPVFTVDMLGEYVAELVVSDGQGSSAADIVRISTFNATPVADAGDDVTVAVGETVLLDAAASLDADNDPLSYRWSLAGAPAGSRAALYETRAITPGFSPDTAGDYLIELDVSDGKSTSRSDQVRVSTANSWPQADAGPDRAVAAGGRLRLSAGKSRDADGDAMSYRWHLTHAPAGSAASLKMADTAEPVLATDLPGDYLVQLQVSDGQSTSRPETVLVEALPLGTGAVRGSGFDTDGDGIADDIDNCPEQFNPDQRDTNGDGYGNICDPDLDNDGFITNFGDLTILKAAFFSTPVSPNWNEDADFNGDDIINFADLLIMKNFFFGPPGPRTITFINPAGGSWHDPANWSLGLVPDVRYTVRIDIDPGSVVEYSTGDTTIGGLRSNNDLLISGGTLNVNGDMQVNAPFTGSGGTLRNANILAPTTADILMVPASVSFTLDGVTLGADVQIDPAASLFIDNDLVLSGATITLASNNNFTYLRFRGANGATSTLGGSGEVVYGGTATVDDRNRIEVFDSGHGLLIGSGVTVRTDTTGGWITHRTSNGPITIQATVTADLANRSVSLFGQPLTIEGTLQVLNDSRIQINGGTSGATIAAGATVTVDTGELELFGDVTNEAAISVTDGTIDIGNAVTDDWINNGSITLVNSTAELGGSYTLALAGTITGTGTVIIDGVLDNTGLTLNLDTDLPGTVVLGANGRIVGGTINGTSVTVPAGVSFTLDGVTLGADVQIDPAASLFIDNDLVLSGATITLASNNNFTYLRFRGANGATSTLGGSGEVVYGGTTTADDRNRIEVFDSGHGLLIESGVTVRTDTSGGWITHRTSNGPITIQGPVTADLANRSVSLFGQPLTIEGTLQVLNDSRIQINGGTSSATIAAGATVTVDTGELELFGDVTNEASISVTDGTIDIGNAVTDDWINNGSITLVNSTAQLGGSYTLALAGTITGTGTVIIDGVLDNTGLTLNLDTDLPGTVVLGANGRIVGGTINGTSVTVPAGVSFTLDGVTLGADVQIDPAASLFIDNDLVLSGATITLASNNNFTYLRFRGANGATSTLGGSGEVVYGGTTTADDRNRIEVFDSGHGLLIESGVTVRTDTSGGWITHRTSNGPITIQGPVTADLANRSVSLFGQPLTIEGTLQVLNDSRIQINGGTSGATIAAGATVTVDTGELELFGDVTNEASISVTDGTIDIGNAVTDDWINNGSITLVNSTAELGGSYTLALAGTITGTGTVIIDGVLDNTGLTLNLDTDLPGTVVLGANGRIVGGTINGTSVTVPAGVSFTLDGVTLGADVQIDPAASLFIDNDLVLSGATITLASNNNFTYLRFRGANGATSTLGGSGEVVYGGTTTADDRNRIEVFDSGHGLLIESGVTVRTDTSGGWITHRTANGPITIQGPVTADLANRSVSLFGQPLTIEGTLQVLNDSRIQINGGTSSATIAAGATVTVDTGELELFGDVTNEASISVTDGTIDIGNAVTDDWINNGSITLVNSTAQLGGSYTLALAGTITGTGTVIIDGVLDNTGLTLNLDTDLPGTVVLGANGRIVGGTINGTSVTVPAGVSFTLDGVTLGADVQIDPAASLFIDNDLVLSGATITLASNNNFTYLRFRGANGATSTLGGSGEVVYGGTTTADDRNRIEVFDSGHGLLIESGVTVRTDTSGGWITHRTSNGPITIQGPVTADLANRSVSLLGVPTTIEGTLQVDAGARIALGNYTLAASAMLDVEIGGTAASEFGRFTSTGTANLDGTLNISVVGGFSPALTDTFGIMTFGSRSGTFATENGTGIGGGLSFQVNYNATDVTLEVVN